VIRDFFARRTRLAVVLSLSLLVGGAYCFTRLRLADYPELAPPIVTVSATYSGASPQVVADTVATPIEDQINGVENIYFFDSQCRDTGAYTLTITFRPGTDSDINLVNVQNAIKRAEPRLPSEVIQSGINVAKASSDVVIRLAFTTDGSKMSLLDLVNAVGYDIKNALQRVEGVTQVNVADHGGYAMRIWLDAAKMSALGIGVEDVKAAIASQNIQPAAGFVGDSFSSDTLSYKINVRGRLVQAEEFASIVVKADDRTEARVLLGDIARCELGTGDYATEDYANGKLTVMLAVGADANSNLLEISDRCKKTLAEWMRWMPDGVACEIQCDPSEFTRAILSQFGRALAICCIVGLVVLLVLSGLRTMLTTLLAVVLSLAGAAPMFLLFGCSLDVFSLFGILFALASVYGNGVVCAVSGAHCGRGRPVSGLSAIVTAAVASVAVYAAVAAHGGMVGMMYVRFAISLCSAVLMSVVVSTAILPSFSNWLSVPARPLQPSALLRSIRSFHLRVSFLLALHPLVFSVAFIAVAALLFLPSSRIRKAFLPVEDRGYFMIECELPEGSSLVRTQEVSLRVCDALKDVPGISVLTVGPGSTNQGKPGENHAAINCRLAPYSERLEKGQTIESIVAEVERRLKPISIAEFTQMNLPPINGTGGFGGVVAYACAIGSVDAVEQAAEIEAYADWLRGLPQVKGVGTTFSANAPQLYFVADRDKALALGVSASDIFATMQNQLASFYVNDFNYAGGAHQVLVQNGLSSRSSVEDAMDMRFPGRGGAMVPITSIGRFEHVLGPRTIPRYNKMPAAGLIITPAEGVTSLEVVDIVERNPPNPDRYVLNWSAMTREECATRGKLLTIFAWAVGLAFLVVVVRFESWRMPLVALAPAALAVGGGLVGLWLFRSPLTLYAQLALLLLLEQSVRHSILFVQEAERFRRLGHGVAKSAAMGCSRAMSTTIPTVVSLMAVFAAASLLKGVGAESLRSAGLPILSGILVFVIFGGAAATAAYAALHLRQHHERIV